MTTAFKLIAKAITLRVPPRIVLFGLMNKINYLLKTGNRRYEFERLYLESFDPWAYHTSAYEREKYELTIERILTLRRGSGVALEVGCSLGVFSGLLAKHFDDVVSIDISNEAIRSAREHNRRCGNLRFLRTDIQAFDEDLKADIITCAEVLYYIREADAVSVCQRLEQKLAPEGLIIYVSAIASGPESPFYFSGWPEVLGRYFAPVHRELVDDPSRPYELIALERRK
ncbi:MAG: methyltransferase domain-containing protein [Phenylobacterium sp.]|nr:MAG: methyltransferase domain-containing protein [Phenylobacterium sp.]